MSNQKTIRCLLVALALIVLLFVPLTLGSVWHHHANSSEANCSICHLDHQPVEQPVATDRTPVLAQLGLRPELAEPAFTAGSLRAPSSRPRTTYALVVCSAAGDVPIRFLSFSRG